MQWHNYSMEFFIVATHVDKAHIHNHIIFNSTFLDCTKKFRDFLGSGKAVRRVSDIICLENGLSIIENPKQSSKHYGTWLGNKKPVTHSEKLRNVIEEVLKSRPKDFEEFLLRMELNGYEVKQGKYIAFKGGEQKKFIRLRSLGMNLVKKRLEWLFEEKRGLRGQVRNGLGMRRKSI